MTLLLNQEQITKLKNLEVEMEERKKKECREKSIREATSTSTGIPVDVVGMDVIKIGTVIGLIRPKEVFESNKRNTINVFDILNGFNSKASAICPKNYYKSYMIVHENDKVQYQQQYVHFQSKIFTEFRDSMIKKELEIINQTVILKLDQITTDNLKKECLDLIEVLISTLSDADPISELEESLNSIKVLRNSLLGVLSVCEYKDLVTHNIINISKHLRRHQLIIMRHLTNIDRRLSLFNGVLYKIPLYQKQSLLHEQQRLCNELEMYRYTKDPQLRPFLPAETRMNICVPSLMFLPISLIIKKRLVGPYRNNSVGFLRDFSYEEGNFYILKNINPDGGRIWVLDHALYEFTKYVIDVLTTYIIKTFRTFYKECFKTNAFFKNTDETSETGITRVQSADQKGPPPRLAGMNTSGAFSKQTGVFLAPGCLEEGVFKVLLSNLYFISDHFNFYNFLTCLIKQDSPIIPTENDFFNYIKSVHDKRKIQLPQFQDVNIYFSQNICLLFDDTITSPTAFGGRALGPAIKRETFDGTVFAPANVKQLIGQLNVDTQTAQKIIGINQVIKKFLST